MRYKAIFFDLDGTLVDTLEDLTKAMNHGLRQLDQPVHTPVECRQMIGYGTEEFARCALPSGKADLTEKLRTLMIRYYDAHCLEKTRPYDGFEKVLPALRRKGLKMAVISNKNHAQTVKIATHYFGEETFDFVCGMTDSHKAKPDPDMAFAALRALSVEPDEAVSIGDSDIDILTARAAGIDAIGAGWGYRSEEVLRKAGAKQVLFRPEEIISLIS